MIVESHSIDEVYYPPPESQGGWRWLREPEDICILAGMDADRLDRLTQYQEWLYGGDSWGLVVIRHGYLVREFYTFNVLVPTRFDIWSGTKSFTGTAWGLLLEDSRQGKLPGAAQVDLDSFAYAWIPEGQPLSDARKERITFRHLLTMTSGIPGEDSGVIGMPTATWDGPFEHSLGHCHNRYGRWAGGLVAEPGTHWEYSDPAIAHLALAFAHITGEEMHTTIQQRIFARIGIKNASWDVQGGSGFLGPHTNAHTGLHLSARELARFGYLMLRRGNWQGEQLVPEWWVDLSTRTSQEHNTRYGYTWWVNTRGDNWPGLPSDLFALSGYRSNRCYIVPSLDLVVARVGSGPGTWEESGLISGVIQAVLE